MKPTSSLLVALLTCSSAYSATLINTYGPSNISVTSSSDLNVSNAKTKTVDASGFNTTTLEHSTATQTSWISADNNAVGSEWIQWDLGATVVLDSIRVWNYNDPARFDIGIQTLDIYVSSVTTPGDPEGLEAANWTKVGNNVTIPKGEGVNTYTGFDLETEAGFSLPGTAVRYVRFEVNSTYWDGGGASGLTADQAALAEIQFFEADAVPEPSAALLGGLGFLVLLRRRRA